MLFPFFAMIVNPTAIILLKSPRDMCLSEQVGFRGEPTGILECLPSH